MHKGTFCAYCICTAPSGVSDVLKQATSEFLRCQILSQMRKKGAQTSYPRPRNSTTDTVCSPIPDNQCPWLDRLLSLRSSLVFWMQVKISLKRNLYSGCWPSSKTIGRSDIMAELDRRRRVQMLTWGLLGVWTALWLSPFAACWHRCRSSSYFTWKTRPVITDSRGTQ